MIMFLSFLFFRHLSLCLKEITGFFSTDEGTFSLESALRSFLRSSFSPSGGTSRLLVSSFVTETAGVKVASFSVISQFKVRKKMDFKFKN